jgi:NDP-sugar pyrophosphorylase family protein
MEERVIAVEEKPTRSSWTNAGIYIMDPSVLELIPANQYTDMTLLLGNLIRQGDMVRAFCLWESWVDIGRPGDYEQAEKDCL